MRKITLLFVSLVSVMSVWANDITYKPLKYEKLPDMSIERRGHAIIATASGDIIVAGGHTGSFDLTASAERLHNGQWESLDIGNAHDGGATIPLPDGSVLICGGMGSGWGIGQSAACDIYDPVHNTFYSTKSLPNYRAFCTGTATGDDNNVLVSGNWYSGDTTFDLWNGSEWTSFGEKSIQLSVPFMVSATDGIVYVFGSLSNYGERYNSVIWKVDTRNKTAEEVTGTGLEDYTIIHGDYNSPQSMFGRCLFIGVKEETSHLVNFDPKTVQATSLTTLPKYLEDTETEITWAPVILFSDVRQEAYVIGGYSTGEDMGLVVATYNLEKGSLTVYSGGQFEGYLSLGVWILQPTTGNIIFTGGSTGDNFNMLATTISVTPFDEEDTGVTAPEQSADLNSSCYSIDGRQIQTPTRPGLYIKQGKKVVVK